MIRKASETSSVSSATMVPTESGCEARTDPSALTVIAPLEPEADESVRAYVARSSRHLRPRVYSTDDGVPATSVTRLAV